MQIQKLEDELNLIIFNRKIKPIGPTKEGLQIINAARKIIQEKKHIMWEVNIWYLIYREFPEIFDFYLCDHNISILKNY